MPKEIYPAVKVRAVRLVREHRQEYLSALGGFLHQIFSTFSSASPGQTATP